MKKVHVTVLIKKKEVSHIVVFEIITAFTKKSAALH